MYFGKSHLPSITTINTIVFAEILYIHHWYENSKYTVSS